MGHEIAYDFINQEIAILRSKHHAELAEKIGKPECKEYIAHDGNRYQLETEVFWDSKKGGDLHVVVSADGGGVSAFRPVSDSFIMAPDGSLIG
jgi:hypothetical protein